MHRTSSWTQSFNWTVCFPMLSPRLLHEPRFFWWLWDGTSQTNHSSCRKTSSEYSSCNKMMLKCVHNCIITQCSPQGEYPVAQQAIVSTLRWALLNGGFHIILVIFEEFNTDFCSSVLPWWSDLCSDSAALALTLHSQWDLMVPNLCMHHMATFRAVRVASIWEGQLHNRKKTQGELWKHMVWYLLL